MWREGGREYGFFGEDPRGHAAARVEEIESPERVERETERDRAKRALVGIVEEFVRRGHAVDLDTVTDLLASVVDEKPDEVEIAAELVRELRSLAVRLDRETLRLLAMTERDGSRERDLGAARRVLRNAGFAEEELGNRDVGRILDYHRLLLALRPRSATTECACGGSGR